MIPNTALHRITIGTAKPAEARKALKACLASSDPRDQEQAYAALRGWTWKAMATRRLGDSLQEWFAIMRSAESVVSKKNPNLAARLSVLSDLVDESIRFSEASTDEALLRRNHLGAILDIVRSNNGRIRRKQLADQAGLGEAHLSQLLTELIVRGKLERFQDSREAEFVLTEAGREFADLWRHGAGAPQGPARRPAPPAPPRPTEVTAAGPTNMIRVTKVGVIRPAESYTPFSSKPAEDKADVRSGGLTHWAGLPPTAETIADPRPTAKIAALEPIEPEEAKSSEPALPAFAASPSQMQDAETFRKEVSYGI